MLDNLEVANFEKKRKIIAAEIAKYYTRIYKNPKNIRSKIIQNQIQKLNS